MIYNFSFLDYIWKGLLIIASSATIVLVSVFVFDFIFRKSISNRLAKWSFNFHSGLLILILSICFVLIKLDPELSSACFTKFVEKSDSYTITRVISALYLFFVGILFLLDFIGIYFSFFLFKKYSKNINTNVIETVLKMASQIRLKDKIEIYTSDSNVSPFVWGLFRFKIVIPNHLIDSITNEQLEAILAHELMHIKDRDSFWLLLGHIGKRLIFFHPLVYLVNTKHKLKVEMAADEMAVLHCGVRAKNLLQALVQLASGSVAQTATPLQVNASRGYSDLRQRILSLGKPRKNRNPNWTLLSVLAFFLLVSVGFSITQARASAGGPTKKAEVWD